MFLFHVSGACRIFVLIAVFVFSAVLLADATDEEENLVTGAITVVITDDDKIAAVHKPGDDMFTSIVILKLSFLFYLEHQFLRVLKFAIFVLEKIKNSHLKSVCKNQTPKKFNSKY